MIFDAKGRLLAKKEELTRKIQQLAHDVAQHEKHVRRVTKKLQCQSIHHAGESMFIDLRQRALILEVRLINARSFVNSFNLSIKDPAYSEEYEELLLDFDRLIVRENHA